MIQKNGFTLMEAIISLALAAVIGVLLTVIIVNSLGLYYRESSRSQEGLNINDAMAQIRATIKEASSIATSYTSTSTTYTSSATQLVLTVPSLDSSNDIILSTFDYYVFFLDSNKLRFKIFPDVLSTRKSTDQILTTLVDNLTFKYLDSLVPPNEVTPSVAQKVSIHLSLKTKAGAKFETITAASEGFLRND